MGSHRRKNLYRPCWDFVPMMEVLVGNRVKNMPENMDVNMLRRFMRKLQEIMFNNFFDYFRT